MFKKRYQQLIHYLTRASETRIYLLRGSAGALMLQVVSLASGFVTSWVLARLLGVAQYGVYTYLFSWLTVLATLSAMGVEQFLVKQTAAYRSAGRFGLVKGLLRYSALCVGLLSVLVMGLGTLWVYLKESNRITYAPLLLQDPLNRHLFALILFAIPLLALAKLPEGMLRGGKHVISSQLPENLVKPMLLLLLLALAYWGFRATITLELLVWLNILCFVFVLLLYAVLYYRKFSGSNVGIRAAYDGVLWGRSLVSFFFISLLAIINNRADVLMLGSLATDADVGIYNIAARLADVPKMILMAANLALAPLIADLYVRRQMQQLQHLLTRSVRIIAGLGLFPVLVLIVFAKPILGVWGLEFAQGHWALAVMSLSQLFNLSCGSVGVILMMTGHEKWVSYGLAAGTVANILLNLWLIPIWGINGAAAASAITVVLWNMLLTLVVLKKLDINPTVLGFSANS